MTEPVRAAYRLTAPGVTDVGGPSDVVETVGSRPVQSPVQSVASVDLPPALLERLAATDGTAASRGF
jgi:hypothetical protein